MFCYKQNIGCVILDIPPYVATTFDVNKKPILNKETEQRFAKIMYVRIPSVFKKSLFL